MARGQAIGKKQAGFAAVLLIVLIILVIGAIAAGGYLLYIRQPKTQNTPSSNTTGSNTDSNNSNSSSSGSSGTTSGSNATVAACTTTNLKLSISNQSGTAGTMYMNADLTNAGTTSCTLTGYPTVFLADSTGSTTGMGAEASSDYTPTAITLAPNAIAHSLLALPDAGAFATPGICSGSSTNLYLYPPASITYLQTPLTQQACPGFRATALKAGA